MKIIIGLIAIVVAIGVGVMVFSEDDDTSSTPSTAETSQSSNDSVNETSIPNDEIPSSVDERVIPASEIAEHNTEDDCWTYIGTKVYDLTDYIPSHPGGDEILRACGTDGSTLFNERQDSDGNDVGSGRPHSANAMQALEQLKIGTLQTL